MIVLYFVAFMIGVVIGALLLKFLSSSNETSVEQAIALLKDKGYYININVTPNKNK